MAALLMLTAMISLAASPQGSQEAAGGGAQNGRGAVLSATPDSLCRAEGKGEIRILCKYAAAPRSGRSGSAKSQIALDRMALSFETDEDSHMMVDLTFRNAGKVRISEDLVVYLAMDDAAGRNYLRRPLPNVDFRKIAPGQRLKFSERLIAPALRPGDYTIELWIPSPSPGLEFDSSRDFLLSNPGLADRASGLNNVATLRVTP